MTSRRLILALIASAIAGLLAFLYVPKPLPELSQQELIQEVQAGQVHEVTVVDGESIHAVSTIRGEFRVSIPGGDKPLIEQLTAMGVTVTYEKTPLGLI